MKKLMFTLLIISILFTFCACGTDFASSSTEADKSSAVSTGAGKSSAVSTDADKTSSESTAAITDDQSKESTVSTDNMSGGWTKIGKTVNVGDVEYTINSIKFTKRGELFEADEGNTYLLIDMNVKNNTAEEQPISSIMMFKLKDGNGNTYSISLGGSSALDDEKIEMIDGSVAAKAEKRGGVAYEVPENATGITLTIDDYLGSNSGPIKLN